MDIFCILIQKVFIDTRFDHFIHQQIVQLFLGHLFGMLGGDHNGIDPGSHTVFVESPSLAGAVMGYTSRLSPNIYSFRLE